MCVHPLHGLNKNSGILCSVDGVGCCRVGCNELIGSCSVGLQYVGAGRDHWFEMLESARRPVAQWYTLSGPAVRPAVDRTEQQ